MVRDGCRRFPLLYCPIQAPVTTSHTRGSQLNNVRSAWHLFSSPRSFNKRVTSASHFSRRSPLTNPISEKQLSDRFPARALTQRTANYTTHAVRHAVHRTKAMRGGAGKLSTTTWRRTDRRWHRHTVNYSRNYETSPPVYRSAHLDKAVGTAMAVRSKKSRLPKRLKQLVTQSRHRPRAAPAPAAPLHCRASIHRRQSQADSPKNARPKEEAIFTIFPC
jgi:hypothetical protein